MFNLNKTIAVNKQSSTTTIVIIATCSTIVGKSTAIDCCIATQSYENHSTNICSVMFKTTVSDDDIAPGHN